MNCKRYLPPIQLRRFLSQFKLIIKSVIGFSVQNRPVEMLKIGSGNYKILMWSQMHGNESTTTKALFDLIPWFLDNAQKEMQENLTLYIIPQLNPDGSYHYTRHNANNVDLNRDAIDQTQPESKALRLIYNDILPDLCLNLHDQRTIYAAGKEGLSASLSFLSPAADTDRIVTPARNKSMQLIAGMIDDLSVELPNGIGRYDDTFNPNCVGDSFAQSETPTILFEAGHVDKDYRREKTRVHVFNAYKALFKAIIHPQKSFKVGDYLKIPKNEVEFCDLIVSGVTILDEGNEIKDQKIAIQYRETLVEGIIEFLPEMITYGYELALRAHKYMNLPSSLKSTCLQFKKKKIIKNTVFSAIFTMKC